MSAPEERVDALRRAVDAAIWSAEADDKIALRVLAAIVAELGITEDKVRAWVRLTGDDYAECDCPGCFLVSRLFLLLDASEAPR